VVPVYFFRSRVAAAPVLLAGVPLVAALAVPAWPVLPDAGVDDVAVTSLPSTAPAEPLIRRSANPDFTGP
jgi:hypothetical protein